MKVYKKRVNGKYIITVDSKPYSINTFVKLTGIDYQAVRNACIKVSSKDFQAWYEDMKWKVDNNYSTKQIVHHVEGHRVCTELVAARVGIGITCARARMNKCISGKITYDEMLAPLKPQQIKHIASLEARDDSKIQITEDMQPRRSIYELGIISGEWERKLPEPKDGMGTKSRNTTCATSSSGDIYYRGD